MLKNKMKYFYYHKCYYLLWFRVFNYGMCFKDLQKSPYGLRFSQRIGKSKYYRIGNIIITFLKP